MRGQLVEPFLLQVGSDHRQTSRIFYNSSRAPDTLVLDGISTDKIRNRSRILVFADPRRRENRKEHRRRVFQSQLHSQVQRGKDNETRYCI